jgi:hypothetical protein
MDPHGVYRIPTFFSLSTLIKARNFLKNEKMQKLERGPGYFQNKL